MNIRKTVKNMLGDDLTQWVVKVKYGMFNLLCSIFPMNDEIILESHPDMTCNSYALYQYMLKRGLNQKYKLTWLVRDMEKYSDYHVDNVEFLALEPTTILQKIKTYFRCNRAKVVVTCHTHVSSLCVSPKQINLFLDHGSHLKNVRVGNKRFPLRCGYLNCQSTFFVKHNVEQYTVESDQVIACGLPRNDLLFTDTGSISRLVEDRVNYQKVILWAPTFRRHHGKKRVDCDLDYPLGLPMLYSQTDAVRLNTVLTENRMLLIIKPHPSSDMSMIKALELSNIVFLYNTDLEIAGVQLNELLAQTDAMITDYSSIYYDYLLLDRPVGLTLDDFHAYVDQKGFVFEDPLEILKGRYMYDLDDLCAFVTEVANGNDHTQEERERVKALVHTYQDDKSSERVCNFILEQLDHRW